MKTLIIIFSLFTISIYNPLETCYCNNKDGESWTAYCGPGWTCEKCCEKTKPKKEDKKPKKKYD